MTKATHARDDEMRARRFVLVDDDDREIASLGVIPATSFGAGCAELELRNADGTSLVRITAHPYAGSVLVARADDPNLIASLDAEHGLYDTPVRDR